MRSILLLCSLAMLMLSGCASTGTSTATGTPFVPNDSYPLSAWHVYNRSTDADHTLSIRTNVLDANAPLIRGITEACAKGVKVSVLLYVGGEHSAQAVAGTCAEVYVSDYPELRLPRLVMLADGILLSFNGELIAANNRNTQQEYMVQLQLKAHSQRIQ
jgi:hypothetical protein